MFLEFFKVSRNRTELIQAQQEKEVKLKHPVQNWKLCGNLTTKSSKILLKGCKNKKKLEHRMGIKPSPQALTSNHAPPHRKVPQPLGTRHRNLLAVRRPPAGAATKVNRLK